MSNPEIHPQIPDRFTFVAWNLLLNRQRLDLVLPQEERIQSHAETLMALNRPLDVVMLCEVEKTKSGQHNGEEIARLTGQTALGQWYRHSRQREYIGMFGNRVDEVEDLALPHNKHAVITKVGDVAIAGVHLKYQVWGPERGEQMEVLLERLEDEEFAVIGGDFNGLRADKFRRNLKNHGFVSVHKKLGRQQPWTLPTNGYRKLSRMPRGTGVAIDDIYVKGDLIVRDAGVRDGDSDHRLVFADIEVPVRT